MTVVGVARANRSCSGGGREDESVIECDKSLGAKLFDAIHKFENGARFCLVLGEAQKPKVFGGRPLAMQGSACSRDGSSF